MLHLPNELPVLLIKLFFFWISSPFEKTYTEEIMSICYIVLFKFNYYFEDSFEISAFVPQGSGSGSMFVQSLRGDPFRVSSAFYYRYAYTETSFSKCVVYL